MHEQNWKLKRQKLYRTKQIMKLKNKMNEIKNTIDSMDSRMDQAEERICDGENRTSEITQIKENKEK